MRVRKRAFGLLLGAGVLFAIGTNVQAGWLYVLSALLLGAVVAGLALPFAALRGLRAELVVPDETPQGGEALVELALTSRARGVRWSVLAVDEHLEHTEVFVSSIARGERVEVATVRTPRRRGLLETSSVQVRSAAPFGVAERRRRLPVHGETLVLPRIFPLGALPFVELVGTSETAIHSAPRRGYGPEYLGVREYRTGDSMRHVHWPLTARHGQVMVREFEEEATRRLAVVVDTERDVGQEWTPLDRVCSVAASLLDAALAHGHGARLLGVLPGGEVGVLGRADEDELLRWLAGLTPSGISLASVLAGLGTPELRGVETVVAVFPTWGDLDAVTLADAVDGVLRHVTRVVCVPVVGARTPPGSVEALVSSLAGVGADVRPWVDGEDLSVALGLGAEVGA